MKVLPTIPIERNDPAYSRNRLLAALLIALVTLALRSAFLGEPGYTADQTQFIHWAYKTKAQGLSSVYDKLPDGSGRRWCNYPPLYVYLLRGLAGLQDTLGAPDASLSEDTAMAVWQGSPIDAGASLGRFLHKVPAALADAILAGMLCYLLWPRVGSRGATAIAFVYACLPAVIHNSVIWGQVDAIPTLLMVLSLEAAHRKKIVVMAVWATLAVLTKAQAMMLVPIWAAMAWIVTKQKPSVLLKASAIAVSICMIVLLPFIGALDGVWEAYARATRYYPFTHLNGFSAWFLGTPMAEPHLGVQFAKWTSHYARDDATGLFGLSFRTWGLFGMIVLWIRAASELLRRKGDEASLFWAVRILSLGFFVMSTQMHERYLFPAMALWAWSAVPNARWWIAWLLLCTCAAVNQMWVWAGPDGAWWVGGCGAALHHPWVGIACALALIGVLVVSFLDVLGPARPQR